MPATTSQKYYIGIDLGTGSTKAVATNALGNTIYTAQQHYPTYAPQTGYSEQPAEPIWNAFISCLNEVTAKLGAPVAIGFSSAMHSIMAVDDAGNALTNAILWADARAADIAQALRDSSEGEKIYRATGTAVYAMSPLCKIAWLQQNEAEICKKASKLISIKEYIWHKLFGVYEVDLSVASATGMLDIVQGKWHLPSLDFAGITTNKLSEPVSTKHLRRLNNAYPLLTGITIQTAFGIGASDGCCANLGGGAISHGMAALTIGTSGAVRVGSSKPVYNYAAMTFNYILDENTFICGGAVNNGGAAVDWLIKDFLKQNTASAENYRELFKDIDAVAPGSSGLIFLPYLYAERAPVWDAKSAGAFVNIRASHRQQHFLRAALEGICFALYDVLNAVETPAGAVRQIVVSGGFISSPVWVQMLADITGKTLILQPGGDSSAIGSIYLAMQALGVDIAAVLSRDKDKQVTVLPNMQSHAVYQKLFPAYKKLYTDLKDSMHLLQNLDL